MSWRVVVAVLDADIRPSGRKLVAVAIAESAHPDGTRAYPGGETLCRRSSSSARTVRDHVAALIADGILVEARRAHTNQRREFRFNLGRLGELSTGGEPPPPVTSDEDARGGEPPPNRGRATAPLPL